MIVRRPKVSGQVSRRRPRKSRTTQPAVVRQS